MVKEKLIKATKEALLARAEQSRNDKPQYRVYNCEALGMQLNLKRLSIPKICNILDMTEDDSMSSAMETNCQLIYESVPMFQDKELQEAYECVEPTDIVAKVLEDNMGEIEKMCRFILSGYGMGDMIEKVKN